MKTIHALNAPQAIGPYSQAIYKKGMLFVSGQLGIDASTGEMAKSFEEQAELALQNVKYILVAANMSMGHIVKVSVFIKDMANFDSLNSIYKKYFTDPFPAREVFEVARLPKNGAVEISVIAMD